MERDSQASQVHDPYFSFSSCPTTPLGLVNGVCLFSRLLFRSCPRLIVKTRRRLPMADSDVSRNKKRGAKNAGFAVSVLAFIRLFFRDTRVQQKVAATLRRPATRQSKRQVLN